MGSDAGGIGLLCSHSINKALHHLVELLCSSGTFPHILHSKYSITLSGRLIMHVYHHGRDMHAHEKHE